MSTYKIWINILFKLNINDLNYLNMFFRGETSDHHHLMWYFINFIKWLDYFQMILNTGECGSLLEKLYIGYKLPPFCISKGFFLLNLHVMDVVHLYYFKSVGIYKHKLSRIESLVILHWEYYCTDIYIFIIVEKRLHSALIINKNANEKSLIIFKKIENMRW